ncbi:hypothetical protein MACH17_26950 [Phaeobacter inhibens]|nr:hypothetical protein MACH17_26950 [Phaeobacter inhibens]
MKYYNGGGFELFRRQLDQPGPEVEHSRLSVSCAFLEGDSGHRAGLRTKLNTCESAVPQFYTVAGDPNMRRTCRGDVIEDSRVGHRKGEALNLPADS